MSEWAKTLLADIEREMIGDSDVLPMWRGDFLAVLERRLLGLLEAGERTRLVCVSREVAQEYDAAKTAAMKESL